MGVAACRNERQGDFRDLKRFGAFNGLVEQKNVVFNSFVYKLGLFWHEWANLHRNYYFIHNYFVVFLTSSYVNWNFFGMSGPI
jgi:hypothetical protein